jgi:hypothetical protein
VAASLRGARCQCRSCEQQFNSSYAFERHRTGRYDIAAPRFGRGCLTEAEMIDNGMARNRDGFWISSPSLAYARRSDDLPRAATTPQASPEAA